MSPKALLRLALIPAVASALAAQPALAAKAKPKAKPKAKAAQAAPARPVASPAAKQPAAAPAASATAQGAPSAAPPASIPQPGAAGRPVTWAPPAFESSTGRFDVLASDMVENRDYLGFRVFAKKVLIQKPVDRGQALALKRLLLLYDGRVGFDMVYIWNAATNMLASSFDRVMEQADGFMMAGKFGEAYSMYQKVAQYMKRALATEKSRERRTELEAIYPFVLHSMARALYGAGRYRDAMVVYTWITADYPRFRQVLFERMWTAFRLGRVDLALGAIASQRSAYFSSYLHSESYLIQNYIYRRLCRTEELKPLIHEMKLYEAELQHDNVQVWAGTDVENRVLWELSQSRTDIPNPYVTQAEKEAERQRIIRRLQNTFKAQKAKILSDLKSAMAFVHLADGSGSSALLQPVEKLPSRKALLDMNLEIWPADTKEEWVDEIGTHRFMGESQCGKAVNP